MSFLTATPLKRLPRIYPLNPLPSLLWNTRNEVVQHFHRDHIPGAYMLARNLRIGFKSLALLVNGSIAYSILKDPHTAMEIQNAIVHMGEAIQSNSAPRLFDIADESFRRIVGSFHDNSTWISVREHFADAVSALGRGDWFMAGGAISTSPQVLAATCVNSLGQAGSGIMRWAMWDVEKRFPEAFSKKRGWFFRKIQIQI